MICNACCTLCQRLNVLESDDNEQRVQEILARLKAEVSRRRLLLYPYFRDFDRVRASHLYIIFCMYVWQLFNNKLIVALRARGTLEV